MAIESTSRNDRFDINKKFLQNFHNSVLSKGQESKDNEGVITMKIVSVGTADDKHYLLPSYDPNTGEIISDRDKLIDKYMPLIKSGAIKSYRTPKEAEKDRMVMYPEIIGASSGNIQ